ncbi:sulfite exporter TauE/SafE family protein [Porticoccaceae bacterium LTM1]|nr:sulfite exporter TauE/SafE family protein [Porticoccaceae bacterium LTM1]
MELAVGAIVGLVLGMTGAGGAVFAVPLFMLLLGYSTSHAAGMSLGVVSISAMVGVATRLPQKLICWRTAAAMIAGGALLAPVGRWLSMQLDERLKLVGFSLLALFIAVRMILQARSHRKAVKNDQPLPQQREVSWSILALTGAATGLLSGLFGVGGGFFVVPILTLFVGMAMKRAAATSLLVISVVSTVGFGSHLMLQPMSDWSVLLEITAGAVTGMIIGTLVTRWVSGPKLQEIFATCVVGLVSITLVQEFL